MPKQSAMTPRHQDLKLALAAAAGRPDAGIRFFHSGVAGERLTYAEVFEAAGHMAYSLRCSTELERGERIAIVHSNSKDFVHSFFAVLAAGCVPVPLPPPIPFSSASRYTKRLSLALRQSRIRVVLANPAARSLLSQAGEGAAPLLLLSVEELTSTDGTYWCDLRPEETAFVQYTSGSTSNPRGVVISHQQVTFSLEAIDATVHVEPSDIMCGWAPLSHDLGLISLLLGSIYSGVDMLLMEPMDFAFNPLNWLKMFSEHQATIGNAPNSAYHFCAKKVRAEQAAQLDLSGWRYAGCGAEMILPSSVRLFFDRFGPAGFKPEAMRPGYGLAEATLMVTNTPPGRHLETLWVQRDCLRSRAEITTETEGAVELAAVGSPIPGFEIEIRDAQGAPLPELQVGEVCVHSPTISSGYDHDEEPSDDIFSEGWLRTGDLGFLHQGELYVTGRIKDLIIVQGRNYYSHDIEARVAEAGGVYPYGVAAIAVPSEGSERLVLLAEAKRGVDPAALKDRLDEAVFDDFGIKPLDIRFLARGQLPRTTSGKLERFRCGAFYDKLRSESAPKA